MRVNLAALNTSPETAQRRGECDLSEHRVNLGSVIVLRIRG